MALAFGSITRQARFVPLVERQRGTTLVRGRTRNRVNYMHVIRFEEPHALVAATCDQPAEKM
jgi:hypothetical protein